MNDLLNTLKSLMQTVMNYLGIALILIIMLIWGTFNSIYKTFKEIELNFVTPMVLPKDHTTGYFIFDINKNKDFNSDSLLSAAKKNPIILTGGVEIAIQTFMFDSESDTGDEKTKIINLSYKQINNLYVPLDCIPLIKEKNEKVYSRILDDSEKIGSGCDRTASLSGCILKSEKKEFNPKDLDNNSCQNIINLPHSDSSPHLSKGYLINAQGKCDPTCPTNADTRIYSYKSSFLSADLISRAIELELINKDTLTIIGPLKNLDSLLFDAYECMKEDNEQCATKYLKQYIYISSTEEDKKTAKLAIDIIDCKALVNEHCSPQSAKELVKNNTEKSGKQKLKLELETSMSNKISYRIPEEKPSELQTINPENDKIKEFASEVEHSILNINPAKELTQTTQNNFEKKIISSPVYSASFDCNKASIPSEKVICNSSKLSSLDIELNNIYKEVRKLSSNTEQLKHEQIQFIKLIRACSNNESCIEENYNLRIYELKKY